MKETGTIRGFKIHEQRGGRKKAPVFARNKQKDWMGWNLAYWCHAASLELATEYVFHPTRAWRFDWAIPALKVGIEYEGIMGTKSRHTTISGYAGDTEKYNEAQLLGWVVLRFTALNYKDLTRQLTELARFLGN